MRPISITLLSAALVLSVPAAAKENAQAGDEQQTTKATDSEKKVCKTLNATGSRMGERVCMTREQWRKVDEQK